MRSVDPSSFLYFVYFQPIEIGKKYKKKLLVVCHSLRAGLGIHKGINGFNNNFIEPRVGMTSVDDLQRKKKGGTSNNQVEVRLSQLKLILGGLAQMGCCLTCGRYADLYFAVGSVQEH